MPTPSEILQALAQRNSSLDDIMPGSAPTAPMGAEPPEFFSDMENGGLGLAPMAAGGTIIGGPPPMSPAMRIALALEQAKQAQK